MERDRREFLAELGLLVVAARSFAACQKLPTTPDQPRDVGGQKDATQAAPAAPTWKDGDHALQPIQRATLAAALARILPTDRDPGATEANVIEFIDRELARPEHPKVREAVTAGIVAINKNSVRSGNKTFVELSGDEQDQILHQVETASDRGKDFIFILVILTLEGFLGDPRWGGNKGGVGWKLIGYGPGTVDGETPSHDHFYP
ncbi:MAG: gluconate 2-dehydrogenase subunit 3 family protein [Myxococcota bacterium]